MAKPIFKPKTPDKARAVVEQAAFERVSHESIILSREFNAGVDDVRRGRAPRYDDPIAYDWNYERGRQWAWLAPMSMPTMISGKTNPAALALLSKALRRGMSGEKEKLPSAFDYRGRPRSRVPAGG